MKEIKIEVYGRVQGVRFRNVIKGIADSLDVKGYVRNREIGGVVIVAQGSEGKLKSFLEEINRSPGLSKVEQVEWKWHEQSIEYKEFSIEKDKGFIEDQIKSFKNLGKTLIGRNFGIVPEHVVIIPDGNRRWAKEKGLSGSEGHIKAAAFENLISLFDESMNMGIKYASLWAFSTENWKRNEREKKVLFSLLRGLVDQLGEYLEKNEVRFRHIGRKDRLPKNLIEDLQNLEKKTEKHNNFNVSLLLDYGGRDEIVRVVNKLLKQGKNEITEEEICKHLDTFDIPDPDLIIRTSGEQRTSGLLPWQSTYSELYFADVYFPDFDVKEFKKSIEEFSKRKRTFGGN
ncbi:di-trans,poly-cis-decaprenylcistransferase [Candidatus Pacearchaeota archaeon]|nr:di-trans,poly-cis-decaprenylcistransferase [Candidatus Pacearchaeota archaeon]|tara:strand:+ start:780 stop:1808 length:1029 start_codon:yes stop_codon:yes gene_type:complete